MELIKLICKYLDIDTLIKDAAEYNLNVGRNERLIGICKDLSAKCYLSGPSAKSYINEDLFNLNGIKVEYMEYKNYKEFKQLWGKFEHKVSIIDLLFNCGPASRKFLNY